MRFDERADSYEAHAAPQKRFAEALAAFAPFRRGARVTELGAGTGFLTAALLAQGVNVDATDASPAMVELGRQAVPAANWSVHNAFGPIEPAKALASTGLLHWAGDPAAVLRHWRAALPEGGRLLLGVPCDPCLNELRDLIGEREEDFARGFTEHLIEYAIGRPFGFADEDLTNEIVVSAKSKQFSLSEFIHALVQSEAFQSK